MAFKAVRTAIHLHALARLEAISRCKIRRVCEIDAVTKPVDESMIHGASQFEVFDACGGGLGASEVALPASILAFSAGRSPSPNGYAGEVAAPLPVESE